MKYWDIKDPYIMAGSVMNLYEIVLKRKWNIYQQYPDPYDPEAVVVEVLPKDTTGYAPFRIVLRPAE